MQSKPSHTLKDAAVSLLFITFILVSACSKMIPPPDTLSTGSTAYLKLPRDPSMLVAVDEASAEVMEILVKVQDSAGIHDMVGKGKLFYIAEGTRVRITGSTLKKKKILIMEGEQANRTGWVPASWLAPVN